MLDAKAFANATAAVMAVWVTACAALVYIAPDLLFTIAQSWTHGMNLAPLRTSLTPNLSSVLLGLVAASGLTWVTTYGTITLYNRFKK
ncbi:hypothetical protein HYU95_02855 [Candidatus Daviesbacteria bacterium]|nr:hypothetical protein [Candidatus Daviesbacteria bacterium]